MATVWYYAIAWVVFGGIFGCAVHDVARSRQRGGLFEDIVTGIIAGPVFFLVGLIWISAKAIFEDADSGNYN